MSNPYRNVNVRVTPQSVQARSDQVVNDAGGYVFPVDPWKQAERFLILGTEGGTYYASEQKLTTSNAALLQKLAVEDCDRLVNMIVDVSVNGRAPRQRPALFALAVAASTSGYGGRWLALHSVRHVCRTGSQLFEFVGYCQQFRGWGRGLRSAVASWYESRPTDRLAYQLVKYRQREGWTHRDLVRLSHPKVDEDARTLMDFVCGRTSTHPLVLAFEEAQEASASRVAELVTEHGLPWEAIPDTLINDPTVWEALIGDIGQTALMRQLARLTRIGLVQPMSNTTRKICDLLTDPDRIKSGRVHPMSILLALATYAQGHGMRGSTTWTPVREIVDALDAAFYESFGFVEPAGKRTLLALDVSSSMNQPVAGTGLSAAQATAAMALVCAKTEPSWMPICFSDTIRHFPLSPRQRLDDVLRDMAGITFGGTDCSAPMLWAVDAGVDVDTFMIYTDNETWAGQMHPFQALRRYRESRGIAARLVVQAFTSTGFTIADPSDAGMLDVVGLDAAAPNVVAGFSRGDF